jgi:flagella basal body P-ring formation protein FlgA
MGLFSKKKEADIDRMEKHQDIQGLNSYLMDSEMAPRWKAASALGSLAEIGVFDISSVHLLNRLLEDPVPDVRGMAAIALGLIGSHANDTSSIPLLNRLLKDRNEDVRLNAVFALGELAERGVFDAASIPLLSQLLKEPNVDLQKEAEVTYAKVESLVRAQEEENNKQIAELELKHREEREKRQKEIQERKKKEERITLAKKYEYALNYPKAAELYEELDMWDDAKHCRELMSGKTQESASRNVPIPTQRKPKLSSAVPITTLDNDLETLLSNVVNMTMPPYLDAGTLAEIVVNFKNNSNQTLTDVSIDFSDMEEDFEVQGAVSLKTLKPGKEVEQRVRIKPKFERGMFPVIIKITGNGITIQKEYTIKVGGTEIY